MARDPGLEQMIEEALEDLPGLTRKTMFGGLVWMHRGNLLCGARKGVMLLRLGKGNDGWALALPGAAPMSAGRAMSGWVRVDASVYGDDTLRRRLLQGAKDFVATLPAK